MSAFLPTSPAADFWAVPLPSLGAGHYSQLLDKQLKQARNRYLISTQSDILSTEDTNSKQLVDRLFARSAHLKVLVSKISMHLPDGWRKRLFTNLDYLHDPDNWEDTDMLLDPSSFMMFLRLILQIGPVKRISLGVSADGNLLAGWLRDKDSLTLEFVPADNVRWGLVRHREGRVETAAGRTNLERLPAVLKPYTPEAWFDNGDEVSA